MVTLDVEALWGIAPKAFASMHSAFTEAGQALAPYGVLESRLRAEHFLAQILHETMGLKVLKENLNYSVEGLMRTWPMRFPTPESAMPYAHDPEQLANRVYGGRMGNTEPGDGWKFIGRGLLMLTGKAGYRRVSDALELDLLSKPELAMSEEYALPVAGVIWTGAGCNSKADADALQSVTRAINGGLIGLSDRRAWLAKVRNAAVVQEIL